MLSKLFYIQGLNLNFFYKIFRPPRRWGGGCASLLGSKHERSRAQKRNVTAHFCKNRLETIKCFTQSSRNVQSLTIDLTMVDFDRTAGCMQAVV